MSVWLWLLACGVHDDGSEPVDNEPTADTADTGSTDATGDTATHTTESTTDTGTPPPDYGEAWDAVHTVFVARCTPCHVDIDTPSGGLHLDAPTDVVGVIHSGTGLAYIEPDSLVQSYLWHKVRGTHGSVGGSGQRMPITSNLSTAEFDVIQGWIEAGAPYERP